ncbi:unnamed protein product (macronuclear) [Paramecium tetraurelia]|uniref:IQ calmodulin-binding motif family protein n=1 Tax=Paramecium tetraurelia TaxID=5888 RepID=A0D6M6_PARTE|nr:uncharacterized protein GSPATT00001734001 [Paramecium tetraurelia]CAK78693.1 unnamed protein product [Paramecium tetraurelia]|eukprot:XP_001446090.1 hypothetical protein (macronuclear) [Paramecium tetraurelia strain d4-2]
MSQQTVFKTQGHRQAVSTPSSNTYFLNSQRKLNFFTTSTLQSISYVHTSQVLNQTPTQYEIRQVKKEQNQIQAIPASFMELYDEFENNYKIVQKIKTDLNISIDMKSDDQVQQPQVISQNSIRNPSQAETKIANLQFCDIDQELNQRLHINRFKFYYFRASISKQQSPLLLTIQFENQINSAQYKLYLSTQHEFPTKFNAEHNLTSNFCKIYTSGHESTFQENYLYITFYTEIDVVVKIKITFGRVQQSKSPQKQIIKKEYPKFPGLITNIKIDLIKRNLDTSSFQLTRRTDLLAGLLTEREQKRKQVLLKKQEIVCEQKIKLKTQYSAQMLRNDYRFFEKIYKLKLNKKIQGELFWAQLVNLINFCAQLKTKLIQFKAQMSVKANGRIKALKCGLNLLIYIRKFGPTPERRSFCKSLLAVQMFTAQIRFTRKRKAEAIATSFIRECISIIHLGHRLLKTRHYVIILQNKFRFFQRQKKKYYEDFWQLVMLNYKEIIRSLNQSNQRSRSRSQKQIYANQIDNQMMQFQIDNYYQRQKLIWLGFIRQKIHDKQLDLYLNDRKSDEIRKALIKFQEPKLFQLPQINEVAEIIELYAKNKKMI